MMRYGLFTERMKALFAAKKPDEHMFLLSIDFLNFKLVNHLYGPVRGTELLRAAADYLDQIPEILLWDKIYADQFTFLVRSKQTDIIPAYRRYAEAFLAREQAAYPGCNLRLACGCSLRVGHTVFFGGYRLVAITAAAGKGKGG